MTTSTVRPGELSQTMSRKGCQRSGHAVRNLSSCRSNPSHPLIRCQIVFMPQRLLHTQCRTRRRIRIRITRGHHTHRPVIFRPLIPDPIDRDLADPFAARLLPDFRQRASLQIVDRQQVLGHRCHGALLRSMVDLVLRDGRSRDRGGAGSARSRSDWPARRSVFRLGDSRRQNPVRRSCAACRRGCCRACG